MGRRKWSGSQTCSARFSPTKGHRVAEWAVMGTWAEVTEWGVKHGAQSADRKVDFKQLAEKKSFRIYGVWLQTAGCQWLENLSQVQSCPGKFFQRWRSWRRNPRNQCGELGSSLISASAKEAPGKMERRTQDWEPNRKGGRDAWRMCHGGRNSPGAEGSTLSRKCKSSCKTVLKLSFKEAVDLWKGQLG